jgi:hypothetical protein
VPENSVGVTLPSLRGSLVTLPFGERSKPSRVSEESQADDGVSAPPLQALPLGGFRNEAAHQVWYFSGSLLFLSGGAFYTHLFKH